MNNGNLKNANNQNNSIIDEDFDDRYGSSGSLPSQSTAYINQQQPPQKPPPPIPPTNIKHRNSDSEFYEEYLPQLTTLSQKYQQHAAAYMADQSIQQHNMNRFPITNQSQQLQSQQGPPQPQQQQQQSLIQNYVNNCNEMSTNRPYLSNAGANMVASSNNAMCMMKSKQPNTSALLTIAQSSHQTYSAPHSPQKKKLTLRMKSLSLDSPESVETLKEKRPQLNQSSASNSMVPINQNHLIHGELQQHQHQHQHQHQQQHQPQTLANVTMPSSTMSPVLGVGHSPPRYDSNEMINYPFKKSIRIVGLGRSLDN
ncbi:hypothetical protein QR98_0050700 [Sarcoptes scabiei]|uniref:Uncharacterized protein n=1 Tax=Sarcoptes scabiei TaxID=52283 RepID=A0A132A6J0_SARSC|nr:hypothetical protein QR98_0050700 [Sarcoptes scabiei]